MASVFTNLDVPLPKSFYFEILSSSLENSASSSAAHREPVGVALS